MTEQVAQNGQTVLESLFVNGAAAFFGAFAAVVLTGVAAILTRFHDRRRAGNKAIIELEYVTNRNLQALGFNGFVISSIKEALKQSQADRVIPTLMNRLQAIECSSDLTKGLLHIDLVNEVFEYQEELRKFNTDVGMINHAQDQMVQFLLAGKITPDGYVRSLVAGVTKLDEMKVFIGYLLKRTKQLAAVSRVLARQGSPMTDKLMTWLLKKRYRPRFDTAIDREIVKLEGEIAASQRASEAKIRSIFGD